MPVNGSAHALVMGSDLLLRTLVVAKVPALYGAVVSAKCKLYSISGRPLDISNATVDTSILIATVTGGDISAHVTQIPHADSAIVACRKE